MGRDDRSATNPGQRVNDTVIVQYAGKRPLHPLRVFNHNGRILATRRREGRNIGHWPKDDSKALQEFVCSNVRAWCRLKTELQSLISFCYSLLRVGVAISATLCIFICYTCRSDY